MEVKTYEIISRSQKQFNPNVVNNQSMEITKICKKCGGEFPLSFFVKSKSCKNGRSWTCRNCINKYAAQWKHKNADRLAQRRRELYAQTEGVENGIKIRERLRIRKLTHPLRVRAAVLRNGMIVRSKQLNLPFDKDILTTTFLMKLLDEHPFCDCCNRVLDLTFKSDRVKKPDSPSIDRIIPEKGYVIGNIALVCWRCNNLKRDATIEELKTIVNWMEKQSKTLLKLRKSYE